MESTFIQKPERRNRRRHLVTGKVAAQISLDRKGEKFLNFRPVDVSTSGIGIWTHEPLPSGSEVFLKTSPDSEPIPMRVRWCKENYQNTEYFRCGLEVADENLDLIQAWDDLPFDRERNEFSETMVMALLGTVSRDIAHDINNTAHVIHLNNEALKRIATAKTPDAVPEFSTYFDSIQRNTIWIGRLVNTMRAFTNSSEVEQMEKLSVEQVLSDVELLSSNRFRNADVRLETFFPNRDIFFLGRRPGIVRAILNLMINAFDAVPKQKGSWVRVDAVDFGGTLEIGVANTGSPMSLDRWNQIVTELGSNRYSSHSTHGLDITSRIIREHNGELGFDNSVDHCRLTLKLPSWQRGH